MKFFSFAILNCIAQTHLQAEEEYIPYRKGKPYACINDVIEKKLNSPGKSFTEI